MRVEYHPQVEVELHSIVKHYNHAAVGLGDEFLDVFDQHVNLICSTPKSWQELNHGVRRCMLSRFPYVIYYRLVSPELLRVTVVKHQRMHPQLGMLRK